MRERKIVWESYHMPDKFERSAKEEFLDNLDEDDEEDSLMAEEVRNAPTLVESPFGLVEINDSMNPFNQLEFWMMSTNFNINSKCFVIANFTEGVECVKLVSRYRMLVGFAKLFDCSEVKRELTDYLLNIDEYPHELYLKQRKILVSSGGNY